MYATMKTKRTKQMVTFTLEPALIEQLKAWIAKQELPPPQNTVVALAIKEFLERRDG